MNNTDWPVVADVVVEKLLDRIEYKERELARLRRELDDISEALPESTLGASNADRVRWLVEQYDHRPGSWAHQEPTAFGTVVRDADGRTYQLSDGLWLGKDNDGATQWKNLAKPVEVLFVGVTDVGNS